MMRKLTDNELWSIENRDLFMANLLIERDYTIETLAIIDNTLHRLFKIIDNEKKNGK